MAMANPKGGGSGDGLEDLVGVMEVDEVEEGTSRQKKRLNDVISDLSPEEKDYVSNIIKERRNTAKKSKIISDKEEGNQSKPTSRSLFPDSNTNKSKEKGKGDDDKKGCSKNTVKEKSMAPKRKDNEEGIEEQRGSSGPPRDLSTENGNLAADGITSQEPLQQVCPENNKHDSDFSLTSKNIKNNKRKEKSEMQREEKARNARNQILENILGTSKQEQNKTILITIQNRTDTLLNVEKANKIQIYSVLSSELDVRDIIEVRINTLKQKATIQINTSTHCYTKSKSFIESIENKEEKLFSVGGQTRWTATLLQRSSVGVVRGVPVNVEINSIKWYCKEMGYSVGEVRRLGQTATVVSIEFHCPLPDSLTFPFNTGKWPSRVEPYYTQGPRKCLKCFEYGHMTSKCEGPLRCIKCGGGHMADSCDDRTPKCPNCEGEHGPTYKECPINMEKKREKNAWIKNKEFEDTDIVSEAFVGIFGDNFPRIRSREDVGERNVSEPSRWDEMENKILRRVEDILEERLSELEKRIDEICSVMVDRIVSRIVGLIEKRESTSNITNGQGEDRLRDLLDRRINQRLEGMVGQEVGRKMGLSPSRSTKNLSKTIRDGHKPTLK